jgi:hypothetical protein
MPHRRQPITAYYRSDLIHVGAAASSELYGGYENDEDDDEENEVQQKEDDLDATDAAVGVSLRRCPILAALVPSDSRRNPNLAAPVPSDTVSKGTSTLGCDQIFFTKLLRCQH